MNDSLADLSGQGLILTADLDGIVISIERDDLGIGYTPPFLFTRLVDPTSLNKALSFFAEIKDRGSAFNYELVLHHSPRVLHFSGITAAERLYIIASESNRETHKLLEELMKMHNEQISSMRTLIKSDKQEGILYEEVSRLNNELVNLQRELTKKNAELELSNKEKNQFLGMAAHDLRNPLHGILLQCDYLMSVVENAEHLEIIGSVKEASNFMVSLIDDLLDYSKIEAGVVNLEYEQVDVVKLLENNLRINKSLAAQHQIELELHAESISPVYTDTSKINQIANNLISNAIKFSQAGQTITVYVRDRGRYFELAVTDHGKGMSEVQQSQLFKPFQKGERGIHGEKTTGLGLTIVKRIIDALGGTIAVTSKEGEGTTFTVSIPKIPPSLTES